MGHNFHPEVSLLQSCSSSTEKPHTQIWDGRCLPRGRNSYKTPMGAIVLASSLMLLKGLMNFCMAGGGRGVTVELAPCLYWSPAWKLKCQWQKHAVQDSSGFSRCKQRELGYKHKCTLPRQLGMVGHVMLDDFLSLLTPNEQEVSTPGMDLIHHLEFHPGVSHTLTLAVPMSQWYCGTLAPDLPTAAYTLLELRAWQDSMAGPAQLETAQSKSLSGISQPPGRCTMGL